MNFSLQSINQKPCEHVTPEQFQQISQFASKDRLYQAMLLEQMETKEDMKAFIAKRTEGRCQILYSNEYLVHREKNYQMIQEIMSGFVSNAHNTQKQDFDNYAAFLVYNQEAMHTVKMRILQNARLGLKLNQMKSQKPESKPIDTKFDQV